MFNEDCQSIIRKEQIFSEKTMKILLLLWEGPAPQEARSNKKKSNLQKRYFFKKIILFYDVVDVLSWIAHYVFYEY